MKRKSERDADWHTAARTLPENREYQKPHFSNLTPDYFTVTWSNCTFAVMAGQTNVYSWPGKDAEEQRKNCLAWLTPEIMFIEGLLERLKRYRDLVQEGK